MSGPSLCLVVDLKYHFCLRQFRCLHPHKATAARQLRRPSDNPSVACHSGLVFLHDMPRLLNTSSALRNRNRITNKHRLKIFKGELETEPYIPDDDEEKSRSTLAVAGVDQEDANEHHLQAVLSEAARRNQVIQRPIRGGADKKFQPATATAYIPTPDSTGSVDNYSQLYPSNRWKDPLTYVCSSQTVEEAILDGLAQDCTYYMDERDKDWLDKNNEEARGEGTSAHGAISSTARMTSRSAKAKGKEPEQAVATLITEQQMELTMGLFEKITHERLELFHLSITGMEFPTFADYSEVFKQPLHPSNFAALQVPVWVPPPQTMVQIARAIYSHWKDRKLEREGHRIMPTLNGDENDLANESYVCFRRREIKAVRKTRAQVTSSDKLQRLRDEFVHPLDLAKHVLARETMKQESVRQSQDVWEKRMAIVDLKRKYPALVGDEELLIDKERPVKKPEPSSRLSGLPGLKIKTPLEPSAPTPRVEPMMRPQARSAMIQSKVDIEMTRQKDHGWEDGVTNSYQTPYSSLSSKLFRFPSPPTPQVEPISRGVRVRMGRGGRIMLDRRSTSSPKIVIGARSTLVGSSASQDVDEESWQKMRERWRFDVDDEPVMGPNGFEEQHRSLIDEYDPTYLQHHSLGLLTDTDHQTLVNDSSLRFVTSDGSQETKPGFRLGIPYMQRKDPVPRNPASGVTPMISQQSGSAGMNGAPVATQMKKLQPAPGPPLRISSNGGMRPPSNHTSPPQSSSHPQHSPSPHPPINVPHLEQPPTHEVQLRTTHVPSHPLPEAALSQEGMMNGFRANSPARPKSQNQFVNGTPLNGFQVTSTTNGYGHYLVQPPSNLSMQQIQNLKAAFSVNSPSPNLQHQQLPSSYPSNSNNFAMGMTNNGNLNLKLPASRQMNWTPVRPGSVVNGMGENGIIQHNSLSPSPNHRHAIPIPVRTPSANGGGLRPMMSISPHQHPSPMMSQSPPRIPMSSPAMQAGGFPGVY
ncbi:Enhancer of polycomb-like protein [Mycena indigotica]|uniref:Enhancer of polycomb-like protein n=1 Tax=Mycena indigotica TaxID=2126181 RepID=A0A8H6T279_9AGAR|nr:Enhancer of polycomb-like protein [Mycena indigotica]KAF7309638.1 Enhancer of polycomb-like protein [Mycena indigotica]